MKSAASLVALLMATAAAAEEFVHDFRGAAFDKKLFRHEGENFEAYVTPSKEGLLFRFAPGKAPRQPVGIFSRVPLSGDFVAVVQYEITKAARPKAGWGVGPELYLMLDTPGQDGISLARMMRADEGPAITFSHIAKDEGGARAHKVQHVEKSTQRSGKGRLRLVREGATIIASIAEDDDANFREIRRIEATPAKVRGLRFAAVSGGDPNAELEMRLIEFRLERAAGGAALAGQPEVVPLPGPSPWPIRIVLLLAVAGLALFGVRMRRAMLGRGKRARSAEAQPAARTPAKSEAPAAQGKRKLPTNPPRREAKDD